MPIVTQFPTANEVFGTGFDWVNPNNAHADDDVDANVLNINGSAAGYWKTFGFDAVIPFRSAITKVQIIIEHQDGTGADPGASAVHAYVDGVDQGAHTTDRTTRGISTADVTSDRAWTLTDLLDAHLKVTVVGQDGVSGASCVLDYVKVEVTYTLPPVLYEHGRF